MPKRIRSPATAMRRAIYKANKRVAKGRRRRSAVSRSRVRGPSNNTHMFTRWAQPSQFSSITQQGSLNLPGQLVLNANGNIATNTDTVMRSVGFCTQFTWSDIPNSTEFQNLYDRYKLNGVLFTIRMVNMPDASQGLNANTPNNFANFYPSLWYVKDYDDNLPINIDDMRQHSRARRKMMLPNKEIKIFVKPRLLRQLFNSTTGTGYEISVPKWVDMANTSLPHFGLKMVIDFEGCNPPGVTANPSNQFQFRTNYKYYFQCKDLR